MSDLRTDYVDDILDTSVNTRRKYNFIQNEDGTYSLEDVTQYLTNGDSYGADEVNETNLAVNEINNNLSNTFGTQQILNSGASAPSNGIIIIDSTLGATNGMVQFILNGAIVYIKQNSGAVSANDRNFFKVNQGDTVAFNAYNNTTTNLVFRPCT